MSLRQMITRKDRGGRRRRGNRKTLRKSSLNSVLTVALVISWTRTIWSQFFNQFIIGMMVKISRAFVCLQDTYYRIRRSTFVYLFSQASSGTETDQNKGLL